MLDGLGRQFKDYAPFSLRVGLSFIFLISGFHHLSHLRGHSGFGTFIETGVEIVGALLVLIGLATRWSAAALFVVSFVTMLQYPGFVEHMIRTPHQLPFAAMTMSLAVFFTGGGRLSVDLRNKRKDLET